MGRVKQLFLPSTSSLLWKCAFQQIQGDPTLQLLVLVSLPPLPLKAQLDLKRK